MFLGLSLIVVVLCLLIIIERIKPDQKLVEVPGWWRRVLVINFIQLLIVIVGVYTWEEWFPDAHLFRLRDYFNPWMSVLVAYFIHTWLFYWFHRARHNIYFLWLCFHQVHHSAQRIEVLTSFYKSPQEMLIDSILMTILVNPILGLTKESSIWLTGCAAIAEYVYHMNIKTPHWIGYFIQRPESHRIHHLRNKRDHCLNYADLPIWDILGGTFENPKEMRKPTGFSIENECRLSEMIFGRDVLLSSKKTTRRVLKEKYNYLTLLSIMWICLGLMQSFSLIFNLSLLRSLAFSSVASPLPLVFSVSSSGIETFSTSFHLRLYQKEKIFNSIEEILIREEYLTAKLYQKFNDKPYNLRNAYGVLFSHGPFFDNEKLVRLRDQILHYAFCSNRSLLNYFDLPMNVSRLTIDIHSKMNFKYFIRTNRSNHWMIDVQC